MLKFYNKKMKYHFIILALIAFVYIQGQTILLTPILPASAFENQFYQVRFRVRNLVGAKFEFKNVPSFFTASSDGLLSGVPTKQGLYAIEVTYFSDSFKQTKQVIIDVRRGTKLTNYNTESETQQSSTNTNQLKPKQQYLYTYNQHDELNIDVNITNGFPPYTYDAIYIPQQLNFNNKTGTITGAFHKFGDYLIGINVRDGKNRIIQILIKITIVIRNTTTPKFIFYRRSMIQVKFSVQQIASNSSNALPSVDKKNDNKPAIIVPGGTVNIPANDQSKNTNIQPQNPSQTAQPNNKDTQTNQVIVPAQVTPQAPSSNTQSSTTSVNNQNTQSNPQTQTNNQPPKNQVTEPIIPQSVDKQAQSETKPAEIVSTQNIINKNITADVNMQKIQKQKDQLNKQLQQSKEELKHCYDNVQVARKTVQNLLNTYNEQFAKVDGLKNELQELRTKSRRASTDLQQKLAKLKTYQVQKGLAQRQYTRSQLSFDNVNFAYNGSVSNINKNLQDIKNKESQIEGYKRDLDNSYKVLDQTMVSNGKLDSQRAKINEQIKKGFGLFSKINSTKKDNFGGCSNFKFYQKSIGVGQVKKVMDKIYLLTNNMFITYGDCTQHQMAHPGDIIEWKGYLMNGLVSALNIKKLK